MYDASDPRAALAAKPGKPSATHFAGAEYARFHEGPPQIADAAGRTWLARGQNFVLAYTEATPGAVLAREAEWHESVVLLPDAGTSATIEAGAERVTSTGSAIVFVPPGPSRIVLPQGGRIVRLFTASAEDLATRCINAASYAAPHPNIPAFVPWPTPEGGCRLRAHSLDVAVEPGRFGRIFRGTTFMVNYLDPRHGPRDVTKLSPHHHDDFEQGSLALEGDFIHDLRWPWTTNMNEWREDEHARCPAPSLAVIPPPAIHTTRAIGPGLNQLVDIFCPPRMDFASKPGWVLNAADYPMPQE
ncbi:hypothetical protein GXW71_00545 [Roseomonas hellenica]|uniref:5-deoxy-glucuronate isomerase n=1 Tax=Plastoroseomonas hellenica TaxID=2687306 RepID=A0ABS5ERD2_9PROT|nr:hypothetical protein [Plastoroseomonas hellenica]MBR0662831.1 hypothetical protein [Plastoroseomonas hellenica]